MSMLSNKNNSLKRVISLPLLVFYGLGNILGAGIYVIIGKVAGVSGVYMPFSFIVACVVIFFTALSYAELASRYPVSAGETMYLYKGFGSQKLSVAVGIVIVMSGIFSSATIIHGFYAYLSTFIHSSEFVVSTILVVTLALIAIWGIGASAKAAALFTLFEVFGLLVIIYVGAPYLSFDTETLAALIPPPEMDVVNGVVLGAFLAFYAFIGFEDMVTVAQEVKNPKKTMPKAIIIVLFVATLLYFAVAWVAISVVSSESLASTAAPLAMVYEKAVGEKALFLSILGMFAVVNGALIQMIMISRILYGMSSNGWIPKFFSYVHPKTATPVNATVVTAMTILVLTLLLPLLTLAQSTSFLIFIIFTLVNFALIKIKLRSPAPADSISYPLFIPITAVLLNCIMLGFQVISAMK